MRKRRKNDVLFFKYLSFVGGLRCGSSVFKSKLTAQLPQRTLKLKDISIPKASEGHADTDAFKPINKSNWIYGHFG